MRSRHSGDLSVIDGVAVLVGVVVGVGIFGFPPLVAQHADSGTLYIALWLAGGALMGAVVYGRLGLIALWPAAAVAMALALGVRFNRAA